MIKTIILISWMVSPCIALSMNLRVLTFLQPHPSTFYSFLLFQLLIEVFNTSPMLLRSDILRSARRNVGQCHIANQSHYPNIFGAKFQLNLERTVTYWYLQKSNEELESK